MCNEAKTQGKIVSLSSLHSLRIFISTLFYKEKGREVVLAALLIAGLISRLYGATTR